MVSNRPAGPSGCETNGEVAPIRGGRNDPPATVQRTSAIRRLRSNLFGEKGSTRATIPPLPPGSDGKDRHITPISGQVSPFTALPQTASNRLGGERLGAGRVSGRVTGPDQNVEFAEKGTLPAIPSGTTGSGKQLERKLQPSDSTVVDVKPSQQPGLRPGLLLFRRLRLRRHGAGLPCGGKRAWTDWSAASQKGASLRLELLHGGMVVL